MKRSAGILNYKIEDGKIKILLCHPGGPFWENVKNHCWGIPKGELDFKENAVNAALREFKEETNLDIAKDEIKYLASKKVSNHKLIIIFYSNIDYDLSNCYSNTFSLEWPSNSNIINNYPENDKFEWIDIEEAYDLIFEKQIFFLDRLKEMIKKV